MTKTIYAEAGLLKRFLAYLIDNIIILAVLIAFSYAVDAIVMQGTVIPDELANMLLDPNSSIKDIIYLCQTDLACNTYYNKFMIGVSILSVIGIILIFVYFTIIPYYFKNFQTVGRYFTNLRVVDNEYYLPSFKNIILRDFLGYLLLFILNLFGFGLFINLFILLLKNKTIGDILGKTKLINLNYYREINIPDNSDTVEVIEED